MYYVFIYFIFILVILGFADTVSEKGVDDFIEEIQLMKKLGDHENVIKMLGCCTLSLPICLILEYAPYGNLLTYLRTLRNKVSR